jgi:hypothetical protein
VTLCPKAGQMALMSLLLVHVSSMDSVANNDATTVAAPADTGLFATAFAAVEQRYQDEIERRKRIPTPVTVRYKPKKIATIDIDTSIAAVAVADLDGDGRQEAFFATTDDVVVFGLRPGPRVISTIRFSDPRVFRSRENVGSAWLDGTTLQFHVSSHDAVMHVTWQGKGYRGAAAANDPATFQFCRNKSMMLAPARNWFVESSASPTTNGVYGLSCREDLANGKGHIMDVEAALSTNDVLNINVTPRCTQPCDKPTSTSVAGVGYAFAIDDLDQNGNVEVITTAASANIDVITVTELGESPKVLWKKSFAHGVIALFAGDFDGDGRRQAFALLRNGSHRADVWRLN